MFQFLQRKPKLDTKVWIIDPVKQSLAELCTPNIASLVNEVVGDDAECFKLDTANNVVWMSETDTNKRYGYYFEMDYPFSVRRYSKGLVISLGPNYWGTETILDYLVWYDKLNTFGDV